MSRELMQTLEQVAREKGLPLKVIVEAMVTAIELAARKRDKSRFDVEYDEATGTIRLYAIKSVVEVVADSKSEISLTQARKVKPGVVLGDDVYVERDIADLGRISAQKAKQIINQKVKEAEKQKVYELYKDRVGDVVLAAVQRIENGVVVNLGEAEAILPRREQIPGEFYKRGDKFRAMITEVKMSTSGKWPQIILSRTSDEFLFRLFEIEVPEIAEGIVEIVSVARDPGARAKICVRSLDRNVDPVGACVGMRGSRIQSIVRELRGEKIDIIEWSDDPATVIARVMTPAKVQNVIADEERRSADLIVADDQLALAIGKRGQNAKLAVKLTQWRINIISESERRAAIQENFEEAIAQAEQEGFEEQEEFEEQDALVEEDNEQQHTEIENFDDEDSEEFGDEDIAEDFDERDDAEDSLDEDIEETPEDAAPVASEDDDSLQSELLALDGVGERTADQLEEAGFFSIEDIADSSVEELSTIPGVGERTARKLLDMARAYSAS